MVGGTLKQKLDQLVDLTIRIAKLEPWKYLSEYDLIEVFSQNNEMVYYCSILGYSELTYGIAVFEGLEGYADFKTTFENPGPVPEDFLFGDIKCLVCFMYEEELDNDQTGLYCDELDSYIYYASMEKRFLPFALTEKEVDVLLEVYDLLYKTIYHYLINDEINPDFEIGQMLRIMNNKISVSKPIPVEKEYGQMFIDDEYKEELILLDRVEEEIYVDLMYTYMPVDEELSYGKLLNPLMFYIMDENFDILELEFVPVEEEEVCFVFDIVMDYIEKNGIPKSIHCRNPYVREALKDFCEKLNIELTYDTFPDIQPDLKYMN